MTLLFHGLFQYRVVCSAVGDFAGAWFQFQYLVVCSAVGDFPISWSVLISCCMFSCSWLCCCMVCSNTVLHVQLSMVCSNIVLYVQLSMVCSNTVLYVQLSMVCSNIVLYVQLLQLLFLLLAWFRSSILLLCASVQLLLSLSWLGLSQCDIAVSYVWQTTRTEWSWRDLRVTLTPTTSTPATSRWTPLAVK